MNDVLSALLKTVPSYVLIVGLLVWILVKALPDSAQFFGDFLPHRRRLSRTRATLESIKAKVEAVELAKKHNIQLSSNLDDAIRDDLEALLGARVRPSAPRVRGRNGSRIVCVLYSIFVSLIVTLSMLGMLSSASKDFRWQNAFIPILLIVFTASLAGCYVGFTSSREISGNGRLSIGSYILTIGIGYVGGSVGLILGAFLTEGADRLLYSVSVFAVKQ
jgi:hypothetical protein